MRRILFFTALFALLAALTLTYAAPTQASTTFTVNAITPSDFACPSSHFCKTIQAAINAATGGDTINVVAGTYVENVTVNKSVTLIGAGQGASVIYPALSAPKPCADSSLCGGAASNILLVQADNVTISGFTLDGDNPALTSGIVKGGADLDARNGIITNNAIGGFNNLVVSFVTIKNIYLRGVYSADGTGFNFHDNIVQNVQGEANSIAMFNFGGGGTFKNNVVSDTNDAISANHSSGTQFLGNMISNSASGVHSDNAGDGGGTADLILGNYVSNCLADGYGVWDFVPYIAPKIESNQITNCKFGLASFGNGSNGSPIVTTFFNNIVDGQSLAGSVGAFLTTDQLGFDENNNSVTLNNNALVNNNVGLETEQTNAKNLSVTLRYNNISGNTKAVDNNPTGLGSEEATVDAAKNWWGSDTGPAGGSIVGTVTTTPFATALAASATASIHETGEVATLDTNVTANGLYGAQLLVNHDNSIATFTLSGSSANDQSAQGWFWDFIAKNFTHPTTNQTLLGGTMSGEFGHTDGANLTGQSIATWKYTCNVAGTFGLSYDTTPGTGTFLSDKNATNLIAGLPGDLITCTLASSSVDGNIGLQGRTKGAASPAGWNGSTVTLTCSSGACTGSGPYALTTDINGYYLHTKTTAGTGIPNGTYTVVVTRRGYLKATKATSVTVSGGSITINGVSGPQVPTLLGGEVTGDNQIELGDLTLIGGVFGTSVTPDTGADVNGDGFVNIFDLVLAGGNYGATASTWP